MADGPMHRLLRVVRRIAEPDAGLPSDERLLDRFVATGDEAAFELLVRRHGAMVLGVCRRALRDEHAAEDAFQATFCVLARKARSVTNVTSYLYGVARRVCANERRKAARRTWHERRAAVGEAMVAVGDDRAELRAVLDEELDRLPARLRLPAVLCYLEGHSTAEAARQIGCPRGTVLSRLATARLRLKVRLTRRGLALPAGGLAALAGATDAPAALVVPTVRAALVFAAGRAVLARVATPHVITLAEGVLRAMFVSKLTMTAAVLVVVGLAGTGAGWVAWPTAGPGPAVAEAPQAKAQAEPRRDEPPPRAIPAELEKQAADLIETERRMRLLRSEARFALIDAEERLRQLQREQDFQRDMEMTRIKNAESVASEARWQIEPEIPPGTMKEMKAVEAKRVFERATHQREALLAEHEQKEQERLTHLLKARRLVVETEEKLQQLDREAAFKQQELDAVRNHIREKLVQAQNDPPRGVGTDARLDELERKINDLLREVKDLRRDLRK